MAPGPRHPARLAALVLVLVAGSVAGAGRPVEVHPTRPLAPDEGLRLAFEDGGTLALRRSRRGGFQGVLPADRLASPFRILRVPGDVPATGAGGQGVRARAAGDLPGPLVLHVAGFQDRPAPPGTPFRRGPHEDLLVPVGPGGAARAVRVHLPRAALRDPGRPLPVIYVLDGQNAFDASTSFAGSEWRLDEALARLEEEDLPPAILVGIDNGWGRRTAEYTYVADPEYGGGEAAAHLRWILDAVEPRVAARYPLDTTRRGLVGSSLGGLFGLWAALRHPERFRAVAALSPSLWWAGEAVLSLDPAAASRPSLWMDMGTAEGERSPAQLRAMASRLASLGWTPGDDLRVHLVEGAVHAEVSWADRAPQVLRHLLRELGDP